MRKLNFYRQTFTLPANDIFRRVSAIEIYNSYLHGRNYFRTTDLCCGLPGGAFRSCDALVRLLSSVWGLISIDLSVQIAVSA